MAKLVVFKTVRPNTSVNFFVQTDLEKASLTGLNLFTIIGERVKSDLLVKVRTVFFPNNDDFQTWETADAQIAVENRKTLYNQEAGITETREVFDIDFTA